MNNMIQRDYSFDYLKGILIFLVVLGHCPAFLLTPQGAEFDRWSDPMFVFIYSFHMPLFMLTTGFFFSKKKNSTLRDITQTNKTINIASIIMVPGMSGNNSYSI